MLFSARNQPYSALYNCVIIIRASKACLAIPYKELRYTVHVVGVCPRILKAILLLSATCILLLVCTAFAQVSCSNYTDRTVYDLISG